MSKQDKQNTSRRTFLRNSTILVAGSTVAGNLEIARAANGYGTDTIKIGLVGCGGRGTGAAIQALNTQGGGLELVAMGDVFEDRVQGALRGLSLIHI